MVKKKEVKEELPEALTAKKAEDFSQWYNQLIQVAGLIDKRYEVKGMFVWLDYGYKVMRNLKNLWDDLFAESGISLYTESVLKKPKSFSSTGNDSSICFTIRV